MTIVNSAFKEIDQLKSVAVKKMKFGACIYSSYISVCLLMFETGK